jgi:hypothetical protein
MSEPSIADELRRALAARGGDDARSLVREAEAAAREDVAELLRRLFTDDLLRRVVALLQPERRDEPAIAVLGLVEAEAVPEGLDAVVRDGVAALIRRSGADVGDDPEALAREVRAHNDLLLAALQRGPVVPLRFGIHFRDEADVEAWLERDDGRLAAELERLRDRVEWGVQVVVADADEDGEGATYLDRRLSAGAAAAARAETARQQASHLHARLAELAADAVTKTPARGLVLDAAYLVATPMQSQFDACLAADGSELAADGLELRITGPWPAYSFVDSERT